MNMEHLGFFGIIASLVLLAIDLLIRIALFAYIPRRRKPTAATAWLLLIFAVPVFGTILFFIIGNTKLSKKRQSDQLQINYMLQRYTEELQTQNLIGEVKTNHEIQASLATALTALPPTTLNDVKIISGYDNLISHIVKRINSATSYIYVEFYILALDDSTEAFFNALEAAIKRGVIVRVLFDAYGSRKYPRYKAMQKRLTTMGAEWHKILPFSLRYQRYNRPDLRNHRKIVVIDNTDAYIGSLNIIDKTYHRKDDISYIELMTHLKGPSVNQCAAVFASDWYAETGVSLKHYMKNTAPSKHGSSLVQIVPSGSNYPYENNLKLFVSLIQSARTAIYITNPYLVPDESLLEALISAAKRGVKVSILNSEAMDQWMVGHAQRSYYTQLLEAGVEINLYKKPQLVHEKFIAVDDEVAVVGSSNLDIRSFVLNLECVAVIYDSAVAKTLRKHHQELLHNAVIVKIDEWNRRDPWRSLLDNVARLTSALQ